VRVAPNEISFSSANSWKDIYGFRTGHRPFVKSPFYDGGSFADQAHSIVSERDPVEHGVMRKYLSHAFSDKSLKEQEYLIAEMVDLFIEQVGRFGAEEGGIDFVKWFNLLTFDIIGSLAFGEPFGGLESGECLPFFGYMLHQRC
jgi:cytochrome P450